MANTSITLEFENIMSTMKGEVQRVLHDNIEQFKKVVSEEVHTSVYPFYRETLRYDRRKDSGGLSDVNNYEVIEGDLSLTLINKTKSNPNYWKFKYSVPITEIVEDGAGDGWENVPGRPFMDKALDRFAHEVLEPQINELGGVR